VCVCESVCEEHFNNLKNLFHHKLPFLQLKDIPNMEICPLVLKRVCLGYTHRFSDGLKPVETDEHDVED